MVTLLTSSGHRELDPTGMPGSNTGDLPQTLVGLLLPAPQNLHLGVDDDADGGAVLLHLRKILLDLLLSKVISPLGAGLGEGLLLGLGPVLVEPPLGLLADVLGPDGLEGAHAAGGLDVADHSDADHGGSLEDGDGLHHLLPH